MNQTERKRVQRAISMRYFRRFAVQVALLTLGMGLVTLLAVLLISRRIWFDYDPMYQFLSFIRDYYPVLFAAGWVIGALIILIIQWRSAAKSMIALCEHKNISRVAHSIKRAGGDSFICRTSNTGVRIESK